ncbi:hypothetical protein FSP39_008461 [Pinctada imbricata]|uniref:KATNIP domain-containing protein n=1 Tax=Pinctada imbricata TaxID=66713 RepID=A0AA88XT62_PINIB|nr:hypothetical protein FSP39_008461 [Pinctada imbricata]
MSERSMKQRLRYGLLQVDTSANRVRITKDCNRYNVPPGLRIATTHIRIDTSSEPTVGHAKLTAKIVHVTIDGKQLSPAEGYLIRKGPGNCHFDYAQEISFAPQQQKTPSPSYPVKGDSVRSSVSDDPLQEYESMQMPCGFIYQLQLISTWGDQYYVGLNGLEFFDAMHNKIELTENNISAYPDSINVLSNMQNDVRTPDKLIDNINSTTDGRHMWLAPILPSILNRVYVIFDQPTAVSMIKIWNYSKTPGRGAKDFALLVDDLLVYNGMLSSIRQGAKGILPTAEAPQSYHTIIFTDNKDIIKKEKHSIISNQAGEQDIQLTNDKQVVSHYNDPKKAQQGKPVNQAETKDKCDWHDEEEKVNSRRDEADYYNKFRSKFHIPGATKKMIVIITVFPSFVSVA